MVVVNGQLKRPRGRPRGARTSTMRAVAMSRSDFTFLRAVVQGISPEAAAERYLLTLERADKRLAIGKLHRLSQQVRILANGHEDQNIEQLCRRLTQVMQAHTVESTATMPTLEQFMQEHDLEMFSEAELQEQYQDAYAEGKAGGNSARPTSMELDGCMACLKSLENLHVVHPRGGDRLEQWLSTGLVNSLKPCGVLTLNELAVFVNSEGKGWHRHVERLGAVRAAKITAWLETEVEGLSPRLIQWTQPTDMTGDTLVVLGIAPLELQSHDALQAVSSRGALSTTLVNSLHAQNDLQAVHAWLAGLGTHADLTQVAYRRDVERFYLWCRYEREVCFANLRGEDFVKFHAFMRAPPAHWVQRLPVPRTHTQWRPFRKPLSSSSAARTLVSVHRFMADLVASNYLSANPMPRLGSQAKRDVTLDTMRSFDDEALDALKHGLTDMPESRYARRLKALAILLYTTGLRISEIHQARMSHLVDARIDPATKVQVPQMLKVVGKGNKERLMPVQALLLSSLKVHHADIEFLYPGQVHDLPLICSLGTPIGRGRKTSEADVPTALSVGGIHAALVRFHARSSATVGGQAAAEQLLNGSAHWWRHTFGHKVLQASNNDLPVVQQLLGHTSINTTAIYVKADQSQRAQAVAKLVQM